MLLTGVVIGIVIAAPVGPVNVLCIQRTLERGFASGLATGAGAVLADGLIAAVAAFGATAVTTGLREYRPAIQLLGGAIVLGFGLRLMFSRPPAQGGPANVAPGRSYAGTVVQTFVLTITNPGSVLGTMALFGGLSATVGGLDSALDAVLIVLGVMAGSLLWWVFLARLIAGHRHRLDAARLALINQIAGVVLMGFGAGLLARFVVAMLRCPTGWCG